MVMMMTDNDDKDDDERDMSAEYNIVRKPPEARYPRPKKKRKVPFLPRGSQSLSHRPSSHNTSSPPLSLLSGNLAISRNNELSPRETFSPHEFA